MILFWLLISFDTRTLKLVLGVTSVLLMIAISTGLDVVDHESQSIHLSPRLPLFWSWPGRQVIRSNIDVTRRIWTPGRSISRTLVRVKSSQQTALSGAIQANSITLTPGLVTLTVEGVDILVHALTAEDAETLQRGEMDRRVSELEGRLEG